MQRRLAVRVLLLPPAPRPDRRLAGAACWRQGARALAQPTRKCLSEVLTNATSCTGQVRQHTVVGAVGCSAKGSGDLAAAGGGAWAIDSVRVLLGASVHACRVSGRGKQVSCISREVGWSSDRSGPSAAQLGVGAERERSRVGRPGLLAAQSCDPCSGGALLSRGQWRSPGARNAAPSCGQQRPGCGRGRDELTKPCATCASAPPTQRPATGVRVRDGLALPGHARNVGVAVEAGAGGRQGRPALGAGNHGRQARQPATAGPARLPPANPC